uniref:histidine kinase n=1 Tax=Methylophaga nitratireducenticrescens TaxID=754476 RepID=I1XMP8_METNJ
MKKNGFGERLKVLLKQKSLTQAQVAKAIGTSIPSVNRWTKGGEIEYENLRSLADFLEINWVWLRYGDEAIESLQSDAPDNGPMKDLRREYLNQILENEARMKAALEMAQIINWEWNVLTGTVTCSENATQLFGVTADHLPNCMMPFTQLPLEELVTTFGSGQPHDWDFEVIDDTGQTKWFSSRAELIYDAANRPIKVIGVSSDITDRKQVEMALAQSEYIQKRIIDIIPVGLWVADETGKICLANPEVKRIWGGAKYVGLEHYGVYKGWWEKNGKELGAEGWTLARAVKHGETSEPEVVNIETFDGHQRTIIMHATPLKNAAGEIIGAIEVNQDITDLKNTERTLMTALEQWQAVFDQNEFAVIQLDDNLQIKKVSEKLKQSLKTTAKSKQLTDLLDTVIAEKIMHQLANAPRQTLSSFRIDNAILAGTWHQPPIFVLHDERQNIKPMTLIFFLNADNK